MFWRIQKIILRQTYFINGFCHEMSLQNLQYSVWHFFCYIRQNERKIKIKRDLHPSSRQKSQIRHKPKLVQSIKISLKKNNKQCQYINLQVQYKFEFLDNSTFRLLHGVKNAQADIQGASFVHFLSASRTKQCSMRHVNSLFLIIAEIELEQNFSGGWPVDKHACVCQGSYFVLKKDN